MSTTVFTPGWEWTSSTRQIKADYTIPTAGSFAPKVASNNMNSFHLIESQYGSGAVVRFKSSQIPNIYENTGITAAHQMPSKTGRRAEVSFFGKGTCDVTNGTTTNSYAVPMNVSIVVETTENYIGNDETVNDLINGLIYSLLLGSISTPTSTPGEALPDFVKVLKGVVDCPSMLPTT